MHSVVLAADGCVYTCGVNDEGALGRPTEGTAWEECDGELEECKVFAKAHLPEGLKVVQIVAGDGFTLCLTDEGAVFGFGQFKDEVGPALALSQCLRLHRGDGIGILKASQLTSSLGACSGGLCRLGAELLITHSAEPFLFDFMRFQQQSQPFKVYSSYFK